MARHEITAGKHIDYGYRRSDTAGSDQAAGQGYKLKDRGVSDVLKARVYRPLRDLPRGSVVLNLGAGDGNFEANAPRGRNRNYSFLSIDQDPQGVASIQRVFSERGSRRDRAIVGDIVRLDQIEEVQPEVADAVVLWRVLHALPAEAQEPFLRQVFDTLKPGGKLYMAVLSDQDWKRRELEASGEYRPGEVNECVDVMRFAEAGIDKRTWPLYFFSEARLDELAKSTGFVRVGDVATFNERSGFPHLLEDAGRQDVTYHFVELQKPDHLSNGYGGHPSEATTIVDFSPSGQHSASKRN